MKVLALSLNTFREALRDKVLYSLLFFAVAMIGIALILDQITIGERTKIIKDVGLASIALFGVMIAVFVGIGLVYKELERKTIYNLLSKPIHRYQFLLGKYCGLVMTLLVEIAIMTCALLGMLYLYDGRIDYYLLPAIGMTFMELMVVTAIALFFSSFSTPILSGLFTLSFYVIGHLTPDLLEFGEKMQSQFLRYFTRALYYLLPNLEYFNLRGQVVYRIPIEQEHLVLASLYGVAYISIIILLSAIIFSRRDFK